MGIYRLITDVLILNNVLIQMNNGGVYIYNESGFSLLCTFPEPCVQYAILPTTAYNNTKTLIGKIHLKQFVLLSLNHLKLLSFNH